MPHPGREHECSTACACSLSIFQLETFPFTRFTERAQRKDGDASFHLLLRAIVQKVYKVPPQINAQHCEDFLFAADLHTLARLQKPLAPMWLHAFHEIALYKIRCLHPCPHPGTLALFPGTSYVRCATE